MKLLKQLGLVILLIATFQSFGQNINERLSIISDCDTSKMEIFIGEVYYFGKNMEKAKAYPQLTCRQNGKRYNLLWVSSKQYKERAKLTKNELRDYVFGMKDNGFEKYPCFAFILEEKVTSFPESDSYISELVFPSTVEVLKYMDSKWVKLFDRQLESHKDFGDLELELIKSN